MERRRALQLLGCSLAAVAGCAGRETGSGSEAGNGSSGETAVAADLASRGFSRFESYGRDRAVLRLAADDVPRDRPADRHLQVTTHRYPRGPALAASDPASLPEIEGAEQTLTIPLEPVSEADAEPGPDPVYAHHVATRVSDGPAEGAGPARIVIAESDRFEWRPDTDPIPAPHPERVGPLSKPGFERESVEGAYHLTIGGDDVDWRLPLRVFSSEFVRGATGWRGHDYPPYVEQATEMGLATRIAGEVHGAAQALERDPLSFGIEVVQRLPYIPEKEGQPGEGTGKQDGQGPREYIKYPAETLVDGGGDCEDTSILLASLLQAPPYDRDCVLVHPTNHMGVGVASEEAGGTFYGRDGRRYFYVETTEPGWRLGALPEAYANETAMVFDV